MTYSTWELLLSQEYWIPRTICTALGSTAQYTPTYHLFHAWIWSSSLDSYGGDTAMQGEREAVSIRGCFQLEL